jgi:hypothetical protein
MSSLRLFRRGDSWFHTPELDDDPGTGERALSEKIRAPRPGEPRALAATAQPLVPRPLRRFHESQHTPQVAADAEGIAMASHASTERGVRRLDRPRPMAAAPLIEGRLCPSKTRPPCLAPHPPVTVAGAPPGERAPQKGKGNRTVPLLLRLVRMENGDGNEKGLKRLPAAFFRLTTGREPVRDWLKDLSLEDRKSIGDDIRTLNLAG